jgi:phenylacetate-coenzyme A ligase PaaK-like adenylate-forming protein
MGVARNSLGYSCPDRGVYQTCDEHSVIEVENDARQVALEDEGAFLIADVDNRAMPFIRFRDGDAGRPAVPGFPCGRTLGRILRLDGRVNDGAKFST